MDGKEARVMGRKVWVESNQNACIYIFPIATMFLKA